MGCLDTGELSRYVEAQLSPAAAQPVREHLNRCRHCAAEARRLQAVDGQSRRIFGPQAVREMVAADPDLQGLRLE